jgi:hypothetical protein
MTPATEAVARRMAAVGYLPSAAVLDGLGVSDRQFVALWVEAHADSRPERVVVSETLLALATEISGQPQRRSSGALFVLTQAVFDRGDVALPASHIDRVLGVLRDVQRLDMAEDSTAISILESAIRRLERKKIADRFTS